MGTGYTFKKYLIDEFVEVEKEEAFNLQVGDNVDSFKDEEFYGSFSVINAPEEEVEKLVLPIPPQKEIKMEKPPKRKIQWRRQ